MSAPRTCAECNQDWGGFYDGLEGWRCPACRKVPENLWIRRTHWYEGNDMYSSPEDGELVSTKPKCPDCGAGVSLMYIGIVVIDTDKGSVTHGGVTGGVPIQWDCFSCGSVERTDRLEELSDDLVNWLSVSYPKAEEALEAGSDWQLRR